MTWNIVSSTQLIDSNEKYLVDTTAGAITLTLPASPQIGDEILVADYFNWAINPVTLQSSDAFSTGGTTLELDKKESQFQLIFEGSQWLVFEIARPSIKITDLPAQSSSAITSNDLFLFVDATSGVFETRKVSYINVRDKILTGAYTTPAQLVSALNSYTGTPALNAKVFDGQTSSFYRNYNNLTNKPTIPTAVTDLSDADNYVTDLTRFDTDDLAEGAINKYFNEETFSEFFDAAFPEAYRLYSGDFSETVVKDSLDALSGVTPLTTYQATNVLNIPSGFIDRFYPGQNVRVFGGSVFPEVSANNAPTTPGAVKNGFTGLTPTITNPYVTVTYKIAEFDFQTGEVTTSSANSNVISDIIFAEFNTTNNISLTLYRSSTDRGILVYRKVNSGTFDLIEILGQNQLGSVSGPSSPITYVDYGRFNYNPWSGLDPTFGHYTTQTGTIHIPTVAPPGPKRGWVDAVVSTVNAVNNRISLVAGYNFDGSLIIAQNDTQSIQSAINNRVAVGINSLTLNDRQYVISKITIPTEFSLYGKGKSTVIKKLPWSNETDNRIIRMSSQNARSVNISNLVINGNMQNQWLKSDEFDDYANYAIDMKADNESLTIDRVQIINVIGGGVAAPTPSKFVMNLSRIEDSGMSDFYEYSPLDASAGSDVIVTNSVFRNFSSAIDLSVTDNGVFSTNTVQNVGTGVLVFGSTFFISSGNILRGPSGEYIPGPDVLNSEFDQINIVLEQGTVYTSDVYAYQENGLNFDLTANRALPINYRIDKLRKVNNVEELYDSEVLISAAKPIQGVYDANTVDPTEGQFKFTISESNVNTLITDYSYSDLNGDGVGQDPNHVGLVYRALLTEYVPSGTISAISISANNVLDMTIANYSNLSVNTKVRLLNNDSPVTVTVDGSPGNINNLVGTVINIGTPLGGANPSIPIQVQYDDVNISSVGTGSNRGSITVENTFILAKGRIF